MGSEDPFEEVPETQTLPNFDLGIPQTTADFDVHSQGDDEDDPTLCRLHSTGTNTDDGFDWFDNKCNRCLQYRGKEPEPPKYLLDGVKTGPSRVFELLKRSSNPSGSLPKLFNDEAVNIIIIYWC